MVSRWISHGASVAGRGLRAGLTLVLPSLLLAACVIPPIKAPAGMASAAARPPMLWDHHAEAGEWTRAALAAVARHDDVLAALVPADIGAWCPGYASAPVEDRRAFWVALMSAVARHESTWNPEAVGGKGQWIGLMQISPRTASRNGCDARTAGALKDGGANLSCAVQIFAHDVARDGVVSGKGNRGMGRQWMPFRKSAKAAEMAAWIRQQPYCAG